MALILLFFSVFLPVICSTPQINLYFTNSENNQTELIQSYCIRIIAHDFFNDDRMNQQILSYCLSEFLFHNTSSEVTTNSQYSFAELAEQNITSQQLYLWSGSIDLIEDYQYYLDHLSKVNNSLFGKKQFYNCTFPQFGPKCEFELESYDSSSTTIHKIMDDFYRNHIYTSTTMTCYTHLECIRGSVNACLDWSEICDGKIDCLNDALDEQHCWQLEVNNCQKNEFRCINGQCIPKIFYQDEPYFPDCLDQSDAYGMGPYPHGFTEGFQPIISSEDIICTDVALTSSCESQREQLLINSFYSVKSPLLSDDYWTELNEKFSELYEGDLICFDECDNDTDIIHTEDLIFIPAVPILFNEIYFAYTKEELHNIRCLTLLLPYICYNNSRYDDYFVNISVLIIDNMKCYRFNDTRPPDACILYPSFLNYIEPMYEALKKYTLPYNYSLLICNRKNMYQCQNSTKCISIYRLFDGVNDCPYDDDEDHDRMNNNNNNNNVFEFLTESHMKCTASDRYISLLRVVDDTCDCGWFGIDWCEDEDLKMSYIKKHISFQTICDSYTELLPIILDERAHTDETDCDFWLCDNVYTRCNGYWNCPNGEDEIGCTTLSSIQCSSNEHICLAIETYELRCLPLENGNDNIVDCVGAIDEPYLCSRTQSENYHRNFYCFIDNSTTCLDALSLCDGVIDCIDGSDELFCNQNRTGQLYESICWENYESIQTNIERYICDAFSYRYKRPQIYFSLDRLVDFIDETDEESYKGRRLQEPTSYCHRGYGVKFVFEQRIVCFCPPSYYGSQCQYQNQRISLSLGFQTASKCWQMPFVIVILLIDNTDQRIIHSYEQFTYLSTRDCTKKFHLYLIYSTRPKNSTHIYSIHIDIYEKTTLNYRGSILLPIEFSFLPVYRLSTIISIPKIESRFHDCTDHQCIHGKCTTYSNQPTNITFCQCNRGWSGRYCTIPYTCTCSTNSICIGMTATNQPICICPLHRFGPRCFLQNSVCSNSSCQNDGQCILKDELIGKFQQEFACICPEGFMGKQCEIKANQVILTFDNDVRLSSQSVFIHFIRVLNHEPQRRATTFRTLPYKQNSITVHWTDPFHLVFIELLTRRYYLVDAQKTYKKQIRINKTIEHIDRCYHINELFNHTILNLHLIQRIKFYQLPCQNRTLKPACFYDDIHFCVCQSHQQKQQQQRVANCFEFDYNMTFDCQGQSVCENHAQCFQDSARCPRRSLCICRDCYYGTRCQFSTTNFGLSLDAILGYHIQVHLSIDQQPVIIRTSASLTIVLFFIGVINSLSALITFKGSILRQVGCGFYLLTSSIVTLIIAILFPLKFWILVLAQMGSITNRQFLDIQCYLLDYFLRCSIDVDRWLTACVAIERAITMIKKVRFNKTKSKQLAKTVVILLTFIVICSHLHDPIHRRLIDEQTDEQNRVWCIVSYSSFWQRYNYTINVIHFTAPFLLNLMSIVILLIKKTHQQSNIRTDLTYRQLLIRHICQHKHLFIAPAMLITLAVPHLVIIFAWKCMKSIGDSWLYLIGYFISFIPHVLTFVVFVLPSKYYLKEYRRVIHLYQANVRKYFRPITLR